MDCGKSSICSLLLEQCLTQGSTPVLLSASGKTIHTYSTLLTSISDLACFLKNKCQLHPPACIALLVNEPFHSIVPTLAVIFAGFSLKILDAQSPFRRLESTCKQFDIQALIYSQFHSRDAQCLLWSCSRLSTIICINDEHDTNHPILALADTQLWDAKVLYAGDDDRIAGGWMNPYDGALFTHAEMDEFANDAFEHLKHFLRKEWRVLEIGCGSGYTARVIAPHVSQYVATDSSPRMTAYLRARLDSHQWPMVTFGTVSAENVGTRFSPNSFNLIIMNSVVHCFPTHAFLTDVIHQCIRLLDPTTGILFIGDVMDLAKRDELLDSVRAYQQVNPACEVQHDLNHVLFLPNIYFVQVCQSIGANLSILPRIGTIENDLKLYDYDVLISMASSEQQQKQQPIPLKVSYSICDFIEQGSIDELATLSRALTLDTDAYIMNYHAVNHRALLNYVDWTCRTYQMNETTVIPWFEIDFPFLVCALSAGGRIIVFDNFEKCHQDIATCDQLTLAKFTRLQLTTVLDDTPSPLPESTIVFVGIYENAGVLLINRLKHYQSKKSSLALWNEYCFDECIDACLMKKISDDTSLSLGLPIQNTLIAVVDNHSCLVPLNCKGRLCFGWDGSLFSTDLTVQCSLETKEIFQYEHPSMSILNGRYINLFEIEHELERLPCIHKVWVTVISEKEKNLIGAVYQVCNNAAAFENICWFERLVTFAKISLPSRLIPSLWARVDSNVDDRNMLTEILLTANKIHEGGHQDETSLSFKHKIQRLVQNILNLDHLPDLSEDFFPERRTNTLSSYRLVRALQAERSDYTHTNLFEHHTLQDIIDYIQQSPAPVV